MKLFEFMVEGYKDQEGARMAVPPDRIYVRQVKGVLYIHLTSQEKFWEIKKNTATYEEVISQINDALKG